MAFYNKSIDEIADFFKSDLTNGLSAETLARNREKYGLNELPEPKRSTWQLYFAPLFNWLIAVYLVSSSILLVLGKGLLTTATLVVVAINALAAVIQQFRAQRALEALKKMTAPTTTVIRGGVKKEIGTAEIVPGDLIVLSQGDKIPADARLITCNSLIVNEASLTGETEPVIKDETCNPLKGDVVLSGRTNMVFRGTYVADGNGIAIVVKTGADTEIGKISQELNALTVQEIPLRKKINHFAKYLAISVVILLVVTLSYKLFIAALESTLAPDTFVDMLVGSITIAMNIMPINIPLLTTIILLTGVLAMAETGVIIRNLGAIDSLGRISVLCTDKTGTLTKNQMTVKKVWANKQIYLVSGEGYSPQGHIYLPSNNGTPDDGQYISDLNLHPELQMLMLSGIINNNAELVHEPLGIRNPKKKSEEIEDYAVIGAPTEGAILTLALKAGIDYREQRAQYKLIKEYPFNSEVKRMTKVTQNAHSIVAFTKGASEVILPRCTKILLGNKTHLLSDKIQAEIQEKIEEFAARGFRILSFAYRPIKSEKHLKSAARDLVEKDLVYLGFVCISDPPRSQVRDAVDACEAAGVTVVMITGDSKITARNVAEELNILQPYERVVEGHEISDLDDHAFINTAVFARVSPQDKQVIVDRYQGLNRVVAMTGDGVNDALALSMADIGIAMGITGTDVAKEAADMVISDDSFITIKEGIKQGRSLLNKIRAVIYFYITINILEASVFFGANFIPGFVMFTYWQSMVLYLTAHSLPPLAMVFDRPDENVMHEKPRNTEEIITRSLFYMMIVHAILIGVGVVLSYNFVLTGIIPVFPDNLSGILSGTVSLAHQKARTMCMSVLLVSESFAVLSIRRLNRSVIDSFFKEFWPLFPIMIGLVFAGWGIMMYIHLPIVVDLILVPFELEWMALNIIDWFFVILFSLPGIVGFELYKLWCRKRSIYF
ncbi:MAG: cation-translocating P-type ATPase [Candidatus Ranarchaeia archaeon]